MLSPLIVYGGIKDSSGIKLDWIDSSIVGDISDDSGVLIYVLSDWSSASELIKRLASRAVPHLNGCQSA